MAFLVVAGLIVARQAVPSHSLPPCPTGHPVVSVKAFRPHLITATPGLGGAEPTSLYELSVDYEVRNEGSAAVLVDTVQGTVIGQPDVRIVTTGPPVKLDPGGTTVVTGTTDVSTPGLTDMPTPDATGVTLSARWADQDKYAGCDV